ncbi:coiled-coil domain-containing protein 149-like [Oscarella lobularis]|uniref:coiled-coil domain-containing protein 149-like n=1 Tax=Oscarella lobularis TaxID=121494 RepID=UPI0033141179
MSRSDKDRHALEHENEACKRKLQSKHQALKILTEELKACSKEKNHYRDLLCQATSGRVDIEGDYKNIVKLEALVDELRKENEFLLAQLNEVKAHCVELREDAKALRRERELQKDLSRSHSGADVPDCCSRPLSEGDDRGSLLLELERAQSDIRDLKRELQSMADDKREAEDEKEYYKDKCSRLSQEFSLAISGNTNPTLDFEAVQSENKYVKQRLELCEQEKVELQSMCSDYRSEILKLRQSQSSSGGTLSHGSSKPGAHLSAHSNETKLRGIVNSLSETVKDKDVALTHQRSVNKVLASRIGELEQRIKTLQVSGLWAVPGSSTSLAERLKESGLDIDIAELTGESLADCSTPPIKPLTTENPKI